MVLYVGWEESGEVGPEALGPWDDLVVLRPGLVLIDSPASRSEVYHALKHLGRPGAPVLVAPLADAPKMSRLARGSTAWVRARRATSASDPRG